MIKISKIDNNLSIYKQNKVVILGENEYILQMLATLMAKEIEIFAICPADEYDINNFFGINTITLQEFVNLDKTDLLIQLATNQEFLNLIKLDANTNIITFEEAIQIINFIDKLTLTKQFPQIIEKQVQDNIFLKKRQKLNTQTEIKNSKEDNILMVCLPPKTGDHTLMETFHKFKIPHYVLWHTPNIFDKEEFLKLNKPLKIITAVREPISRDISSMYQGIEFIFDSPMINKLNLQNNSEHFMTNGGDAQEIFDLHFNSKDGVNSVNDFINDFKENIIDLLAYPFDKNLGYSIIKDAGVEVFVYQLEKIESIISPLNDWLGCSIDSLVLGNLAENKWISNSYNQAKNDIKIDLGYLEKSYTSDWVKHFYSDEDISKFKSKWNKNIK